MSFIRKVILTGIILVTSFGFTSQVLAESEVDDSVSQGIKFDELSSDQKKFFESEGFDSDAEFYSSSTIEIPSSDSIAVTRKINVITMVAATTKVNSTKAKTSTYITSSNSLILSAALQIKAGSSKTVTYQAAGGNIKKMGTSKNWTFTGKKKYLGVKVAAQVTTLMGTTPVGCSAGGVTLGK